MHEISIAGDLSEIVLEVAGNEKLTKVTKVNICFGQLIQIVPDLFISAFGEIVKYTVAKDAEVEIEIIKIKLACKKCKHEFLPVKNKFVCNRCGSGDIDIIKGKELFIKSIEGDRQWK
jgi:hydrogenase nickel incorporation protein HypA/HybF